MGLINLLLETNPEQFQYYSSKGYTSGGTVPGMKSVPFPTANENGKPLITFDINNGNSDVPPLPLLSSLNTLSSVNGANLTQGDSILRGGLSAPLRAGIDVARLNRWSNNPKNLDGFVFELKQNLLSRLAPRTEATKIQAGYLAGIVNSGVYLNENSIAAAGLGFLGVYINKQGILDISTVLGINKYDDVIKAQEFQDNRLVLLRDAIENGRSKNLPGVLNYRLNEGATSTIPGVNVMRYGGGAGAALGFIGKTNIRFADQRTGKLNPNIPLGFYNDGS